MFLRILASICFVFAISDAASSQEQTTICHFTSGPRLGQTENWKDEMRPVEIGWPCSDGAGNVGLFIPQSAPQASTAVRQLDPLNHGLVRSGPLWTPGLTSVCLYVSGPRTGQAEDRAGWMAQVPVGSVCGDGYGSLGFFISPSAPQARSAYLMKNKDDFGVRPVTPGHTTICTYTSGTRKGETEDWRQLISPLEVGQPCDDKAGSFGFFVPGNAPQVRTATLRKSWASSEPPPTPPDEDHWDWYTDPDGLIHSKKMKDGGTNNPLLYTAYACVTMQLRGMSYHKDKIAGALKKSSVKPGLFNRSPSQSGVMTAHDDYWGLGALAGICEYHNVAHDILVYGKGPDQPSGATVVGLNLENFGPFADKVRQCTSILYNYNNTHPGTYTNASWMGRYPALITHWKIADGQTPPTPDEFAVWAATLLIDATKATIKGKEAGSDPWLLGWIQVLTYQMSRNHSAAADSAVADWWKMLHARYPEGGIKQAMKDHLAGEAPTHPLAKYIDNFENARHPDVRMTDSSNNTKDLLDQIKTLFTSDCGPGNPSCLKFSDLSPTNFLAPFTLGETTSERLLNEASRALELHDSVIANQPAEMRKAAEKVSNLDKGVTDLATQHAQLSAQINDLTIQLNQIPTPGGHFIIPKKRVCDPIFGKCQDIPIGGPVWVPDAANPLIDDLGRKIADLQAKAKTVADALTDLNNQLQAARRDLTEKSSIEALLSVQRQLQEKERKARGALESARGTARLARAIIDNLVPCGRL